MNNLNLDEQPACIETMLKTIKVDLLKIALKEGDYETLYPAVTVHRRNSPTDTIPCIYEMGLAVTISGQKQVSLGNTVFNYSAGQALLASVDLPVISRVTEANDQEPYLGIMIRLEPHLVMQVVNQMVLPPTPKSGKQVGLEHGTLDSKLLNAVLRMVEALSQPELLEIIAPLIQQEIIARLLLSEKGQNFIQLHASASPSRQIAKTLAWLKVNYAKPINIETLAENAHMSPTTFRQHFRSVSGMSPLQYLKNLRLQEARQIMLNEGVDAGQAGLGVGYESVSQFSREYARLFGLPPSKDIKALQAEILQGAI